MTKNTNYWLNGIMGVVVGGLTHAHIRSNIACGLYFFMVDEVLNAEGSLRERLQAGLTRGFAFYETFLADKDNLRYYGRLKDLDAFAALPADRIPADWLAAIKRREWIEELCGMA